MQNFKKLRVVSKKLSVVRSENKSLAAIELTILTVFMDNLNLVLNKVTV